MDILISMGNDVQSSTDNRSALSAVFAGVSSALAAINPYVDIENTEKALKEADLTPTKLGGYNWNPWSCPKGLSRTMFEAVNPKGEPVSGTVCRTGLGLQTIRYNKSP